MASPVLAPVDRWFADARPAVNKALDPDQETVQNTITEQLKVSYSDQCTEGQVEVREIRYCRHHFFCTPRRHFSSRVRSTTHHIAHCMDTYILAETERQPR